jgi:hypothetical protein
LALAERLEALGTSVASGVLAVDALADELLAAINDFPTDRPFSRDPVRGESERRLAEAYNRLYCELHDKPQRKASKELASDEVADWRDRHWPGSA